MPVVAPDAADAIVIVKLFTEEVITSNVFVSKSDATYPAPVGGVTEVKVNKSETSNPCPDLFTVTVAEVFVVVNVHPVTAVCKGVMS